LQRFLQRICFADLGRQTRLGVACLLLCASAAWADGLAGRFEVRSADLELKEGVYLLNTRLTLPVGDAVKKGLADGAPLALEIELVVTRTRRLLPNSDVAQLSQRYHLQFNAVSGRYVLRNDNSGEQTSHATAEEALERLAVLRGVPVLDRSLLSGERRYEANLRAKMDFGDVPLTLRLLMFWVDDWHRESEWYTWTVTQ
jgi:Domain of unknown function (DUF4390)